MFEVQKRLCFHSQNEDLPSMSIFIVKTNMGLWGGLDALYENKKSLPNSSESLPPYMIWTIIFNKNRRTGSIDEPHKMWTHCRLMKAGGRIFFLWYHQNILHTSC